MPAQAVDEQPSLAMQVRTQAEFAVSLFQKNTSEQLDFSEKSLIAIEKILVDISNHGTSPDNIEMVIDSIGSYILEVAYRQHGGVFKWYEQHSQPALHEQQSQPVLIVGEPGFHIAIMTFDKVRGRLSGDEGDNIPFFYQGFADRIKSAKPGARALYI